MTVEFKVLGPLEVWHDGELVPLPSGRARVLLASLLLRANEVVSVDELVDRVWDSSPPTPTKAKANLHMVVSRLRQALGGADRVRTAFGGYRVEVPPEALDLELFRSRAAAGRFAEALEVWRGAPLTNVVSDSLHRDEVAALLDERLDVLERRIEADLDAGRLTGLVVELRALTRRHPLRERFWAQLMLALHRSDQQAEAFLAYRTVSDLLADELGVDPGPALERAHRLVLANDGEPAVLVVPRQLPPRTTGFVGRQAELLAVDDGGRPSVVVVHGPGGAGKTAFALHWAHREADRFPDGQLYLDLRGFSPTGRPVEPAAALEALLDALEVKRERVPADLDGRASLLRSILADRKMVLLLDNAASSGQVEHLLPGTSSVITVVTSRNQLRGLVARYGAHRVELTPLGRAEAVELLSSVLGAVRVDADPDAVDEIIRRCAGLPLALRVFAERTGRFPNAPLRAFADELRDERSRLDALSSQDGEGTDLRAVFSWSYQALDETAARLFRLLGTHPGPDIALTAVAALLDEPVATARRHLERLVADHLVRSSVPGRYDFHDLLRAYAVELSELEDDAVREGAAHRVAQWYLHTAQVAAARFPSAAAPVEGDVPPGLVLPRFDDAEEAGRWFRTEWPNLVAVTRAASERGWHDVAWRIPNTMWLLLDLVPAGDKMDVLRIAAESAGLAGTSSHHGSALNHLAHARADAGDGEAAIRTHLEALDVARAAGDRRLESVTLISVGSAYNRMARYSEGLPFQERGLEIAEELGNLHHQAATHHNIAYALRNLYRFDEASERSERALALYAELGDELNYGRALESRAVAHVAHGRFEEAVEVIQQGLATTRRFGDVKFEGNYLDHLGTALLCLGRLEEARRSWRRAVDLLAEDEAGRAGVLLTWLADLDGLDEDLRVDVLPREASEVS